MLGFGLAVQYRQRNHFFEVVAEDARVVEAVQMIGMAMRVHDGPGEVDIFAHKHGHVIREAVSIRKSPSSGASATATPVPHAAVLGVGGNGQTSQWQPIIGTPLLVPVPSRIICGLVITFSTDMTPA